MTRDELVWKMVKEFERRCTANYSQGNPVDSMSAVLRVCVDELLGDPTVKERDKFTHFGPLTAIKQCLEDRRARYSPPKPKTAQEKIEAILDATFIGPGTNSIVAAKIVAELNLKEQK